MIVESQDKFMRRCIDLAGKAEGLTYPNPLVGAVLVYDDKIIGEGYHLKAGEPHAEVNAINSVTEKSLIPRSILYVSLEPCSHFGKTPPCADQILDWKIPKIVIGTTDTSNNVSGNGIRKLLNNGKEVVTGILEEECRWLNRRFFTFHEKRRPYIILKWAQSADGYIDVIRETDSSAEPHWISGKPERVLVHKWRAEEQAILVGAGTARNDNPSLNVRYWSGTDPVKLILSNSGDIDKYLTVNETNGTVIVFTGNPGHDAGNAVKVELKKDSPAAVQIARYLYDNGLQSLFIEGGAQVLSHFISTGLWDEARIFTGNVDFRRGVKAPGIKGKQISMVSFDLSRLETLINDPN